MHYIQSLARFIRLLTARLPWPEENDSPLPQRKSLSTATPEGQNLRYNKEGSQFSVIGSAVPSAWISILAMKSLEVQK